MATQWKTSFVEGQISSLGSMRHTAGDGDIFSKSGRSTNVTLRVHNLRLSDDGNAWEVDVLYRVKEGRRDFTTFEFARTARLPLPVDAMKGSSFIHDVRDYNKTFAVFGEVHEVMEVPHVENTAIYSGQYRIDSRGPDQGAVFVDLLLKIPFTYLDTVP